jgi:hypothetical protein
MSPADVERWLQDTQQGQTLPRLGNLTTEHASRLVSVPR